ncbi:hypothetical protein ACFQBQ_00785 [Granulicella cerasi]|uniref:Terminase small subunit n=1 Tax=Granulicella cerasi TaxID=741063 RepID=A0ABW1Z441_9BACT|nr:hypothetical protein [Granulicella cerasi]
MPRPRTPTSRLELTGALTHDAKRYAPRADEPTPAAPIGDAPEHLNDAQKAIWAELVSISLPDVLANADRFLLELTVRMMNRLREDTASDSNLTTLRQCLAQLGMTPADRSRVSSNKQETPVHDEWSNLIH